VQKIVKSSDGFIDPASAMHCHMANENVWISTLVACFIGGLSRIEHGCGGLCISDASEPLMQCSASCSPYPTARIFSATRAASSLLWTIKPIPRRFICDIRADV
jgi:hypothetical protein